jgi:uncharacterized protein (TIGR00725 family)
LSRLPIVGVMGSGTAAHAERAARLGRFVAERGAHLLTGGGQGVMAAVSRAFAETPGRRGLALGILPSGKEGYPNDWIEVAVRTHLPLTGARGSQPLSRNHINVLTADVVVALPGGAGTLSEVRLALQYGRPLIAYLERRDEIPGLPEAVRAQADFGAIRAFVETALAESAA